MANQIETYGREQYERGLRAAVETIAVVLRGETPEVPEALRAVCDQVAAMVTLVEMVRDQRSVIACVSDGRTVGGVWGVGGGWSAFRCADDGRSEKRQHCGSNLPAAVRFAQNGESDAG